jgi:uncharacterized protein YodC (DUF2158 family)
MFYASSLVAGCVDEEFNMAKFMKGEIVQLKSGGPEMTVDICPGERSGYYEFSWTGRKETIWDRYRCLWFAGKELHSGNFDEDALISVKLAVEKK